MSEKSLGSTPASSIASRRTEIATRYEGRIETVNLPVHRASTVLFDSLYPANIGEDYSDYRDVSLTLKGEYGARTTRDDRGDPSSAVLYVAAPIRARGETVGVLTVAEPTSSVNAFLRSAKPRIIRIGLR